MSISLAPASAKTKRTRCVAITNNATHCKRYAISGKVYCIHHQRQLTDCADVGQQAAINFDKEEQGPGLIEELWALIADDFTVLELRPLLLTCKTLFRLYTSQKWYQSHTRYLWVKQIKTKPYMSKFQDNTSKQVFYGNRGDSSYRLHLKGPSEGHSFASGNESTDFRENLFRPALFVVNSYVAAREIYRSIVKRGKKKVCSISFDKSASNLMPTVLDIIITETTTTISRRLVIRVIMSFKRCQPFTLNLQGLVEAMKELGDLGKNLIKVICDNVVEEVKATYPKVSYEINEKALVFNY